MISTARALNVLDSGSFWGTAVVVSHYGTSTSAETGHEGHSTVTIGGLCCRVVGCTSRGHEQHSAGASFKSLSAFFAGPFNAGMPIVTPFQSLSISPLQFFHV
jgi:hypothetical protein